LGVISDLDLFNILISPFKLFLTNNERVYWLFLLSAFTIAYILFVVHKQEHARLGKNALAVIFPKDVLWHRSSINDYLFFYTIMLFQGSFIVIFFSSLSFVVSNLTETNLNILMPSLNGELQGIYGMGLVMTLFLAVVADFALFFSHFLQHRIPWLWEFHKVHHSAEVMTPITVYRMHPVDNILVFSMGGLLSGLAMGCAAFLMGRNVVFYNVAGVNVILILFYLLGYNLRHSHIWWSWGPFFSRVFISPAQHQIHHSSAPEHFDKNLGFTFAFWDGLFGSLYVPKAKENINFGLGVEENEKFSTFWSLYLMPFINLYDNFSLKMLLEPKRYVSVLVFLIVVLPAVYLNHNSTSLAPVRNCSNCYLEDMTWQEVRDAIKNGSTTVLVPTGGTEQNGPHVVLGKHNYIVKYTAGKIAETLGKTLIAPVISYVPEGSITPADGHMRFAGTLSISETEFDALLEAAARSLKQHGFKTIAFIGDSGGNQAGQKRVAERLTTLWQNEGVRVIHVNDYYEANAQRAYLLNNGYSELQIGGHAGIRDTSELMAVNPAGIRAGSQVDHMGSDFMLTGADGDASKASPLIGNILLNLKIEAAVKQIRKAAG
jgi:sterol desaturase/sphingolipid hydroxylase (fatty acid hydroxylase superfamily)/creatinine amidohydrolase/Fe(II)-dependent formamide hydrolase-like protein